MQRLPNDVLARRPNGRALHTINAHQLRPVAFIQVPDRNSTWDSSASGGSRKHPGIDDGYHYRPWNFAADGDASDVRGSPCSKFF